MATSSQVRSHLVLALAACLLAPARDALASLDFGGATPFTTGAAPNAVVAADLDRDGRLDLVTANVNANSVSVLLGAGGGNFGAKTDFVTGTAPLGVAVGDLNGDGDLDVVTANSGANTVSVLLGAGTGALAAKVDYPTGAVPSWVSIADLDRDGDLDLAVTNRSDPSVAVYFNTGAGAFGARTSYATAGTPRGVVVADLDRNGLPDLAVASSGGNAVSVRLATSAGVFGGRIDYATGSQPFAVAAGDLDGDGVLDLVTSNYLAATVSVLRGTGAGAFAAKTDFAAGTNPHGVAIGDLDGDGDADVATANYVSDDVSLLPGAGDGSLGAKVDLAAGDLASGIAIADLDGDGRQDCVSANAGPSNVVVRLNTHIRAASGTFCNLDHLGAGTKPDCIAVGDLNRDGRPDLVAGNDDGTSISVLLAQAGGGFAAEVEYPATYPVYGIALADVNRDGRLDVIASCKQLGFSNGDLVVRLGSADGSLGAPTSYPAGGYPPLGIAVADLNHDDIVDLVVPSGTGVRVYLGTAAGTFPTGTAYSSSAGGNDVAIGDVDLDGDPDLAVSNNLNSTVSILRNNGNGTFAAHVDYDAGAQPYSVALGDLNRDGRPDLAVVSRTVALGYTLLNDGSGGFLPKTAFPLLSASNWAVEIADLNGDGAPDVATCSAANRLSVFYGDGTGALAPRRDFGAGPNNPYALAIADVDRDGQLDVASAHNASTTVSVLLNGCASVSIDDVTAAEGESGTTPFGFTVSLAEPASRPVTLDWISADSTAKVAGNDYVAGGGSLTFLPGETAKPVVVDVVGDAVAEYPETFAVKLSNPGNAVVARAAGVGHIVDEALGIADAAPAEFTLAPPRPNPARNVLEIGFSLPYAAPVRLTVFDVTGRELAQLADRVYPAGRHTLEWRPGRSGAGVYLVRLETGGRTLTRRMICLR